mgnify:CR=1 FL=1
MKQPFIRDGSRTIEALVKDAIATTGRDVQAVVIGLAVDDHEAAE